MHTWVEHKKVYNLGARLKSELNVKESIKLAKNGISKRLNLHYFFKSESRRFTTCKY